MSNELTIGIIGLYTVVYVIVFFVQKAQIDSIKSINEANKSTIDTMKALVELMDVDKFKKYNDMRTETAKMEIKTMLSNDEKVRELVNDVSKNTLGKVQEFYKEKTGAKVNEFFLFTLFSLKQLDKEDRDLLIKTSFPLNSELLYKALTDLDNEENKSV